MEQAEEVVDAIEDAEAEPRGLIKNLESQNGKLKNTATHFLTTTFLF